MTNGIPDSILEMNETDQEGLRAEAQEAEHPRCEVCDFRVCLSDCCDDSVIGVVAPEDREYATKTYVHQYECLDIWNQPTVTDVAARLGNGGAS